MKTLLFTVIALSSIKLFGQDINQAIELYSDNKTAQSESILKRISDSHQEYDKAQFYLGRIAFDKEDYDAAEEYFEEAIEVNDNESDYHLWLGNTFGVVAQNSNVFTQGLLAPKIKREYERAVSLNDKNEDALWGLVQYYTQAPSFMGGSYDLALEMADKLSKVNMVRSHAARATVYSAQEEYELMEREYKSAALLEPIWYINLGYFYQQREQYEKAFTTFEQLSDNEELKWAACYQIGRTSALSGKQTERGIESLALYLTREHSNNLPSHAAAKMRLAMIYEKRGEQTKAIDYYTQSLKEDPEMEEAKKGLDRLQ